MKPNNSRLLLEYLPILDIFVCLDSDKELNKKIVESYFPKSTIETFHKDNFRLRANSFFSSG